MSEWDAFLRRLTLERQGGMPRWNLTPAPERTPRAFDDSPGVVDQRRAELEALEEATGEIRATTLRRIA